MDDATCFKLIQQGGDAAEKGVTVLYRRYAPQFTSGLMKSYGFPLATTQDVVQDAFVSMVRHIRRRGSVQVNLGWMWTSVHNMAKSALRKPEYRRLVLATAGANHEEKEMEPQRGTPQEELSDEERVDVRRAWRAFAADHRDRAEVLQRAALEGWSTAQLAQYLERSPGATRQYLSECRKVLRAYLQR